MNDNQDRKTPQNPMGEPARPGKKAWLIVLALLGLWLAVSWYQGAGGGMDVSYTRFKKELDKGNVASVTVQGSEVRGQLKEPSRMQIEGAEKPATFQRFVTYVPSFGDDGLLAELDEAGVEVETRPEKDSSAFWYLIISFLPLLLIGGLVWMQYKRMQGAAGGGLFNIGKSQAKQYDKSKVETTFEDVAGAEAAKRELSEIVSFLKDPKRIRELGGEVPKGMLLVGAPGTGKTLLARAVAGEAGVPFLIITGSDFMEMFVGVGASRVRNLFKDAKKDAPAIIFIDELDSIGRQRGAGLGGGHDEREQTLNQLLSEMDGFEPNEDVIVMSATNRPDILDPALLRPGRFDRRVVVELPSKKDRLAILELYAKNKPLAGDVDLDELARSTPGFSGADLENLLNEAALLAARDELEEIDRRRLDMARDKIVMGLKRQGLAMNEEEKRLVAFHEAGHAVTAAALKEADPLHKVSIVPRTRSMGATQQFPEKDKYIFRKEYMMDRLGVMLGGRAAENLVFDTVTSGAGNDLQQAFKLARRMVLEWGMSDEFGHMAMGGPEGSVFLGEELAGRREYSESTATSVDREVKILLDTAFERALKALEDNREGMDALVEELMDSEELSGERVLEILGLAPEAAEDEDSDGQAAAAAD